MMVVQVIVLFTYIFGIISIFNDTFWICGMTMNHLQFIFSLAFLEIKLNS